MGNELSNSLPVSGHSTMLLGEGIEVCKGEKKGKKKKKKKNEGNYALKAR